MIEHLGVVSAFAGSHKDRLTRMRRKLCGAMLAIVVGFKQMLSLRLSHFKLMLSLRLSHLGYHLCKRSLQQLPPRPSDAQGQNVRCRKAQTIASEKCPSS